MVKGGVLCSKIASHIAHQKTDMPLCKVQQVGNETDNIGNETGNIGNETDNIGSETDNI